ncbi:MAG: hypothetical protein JNL19_13315 [Burkholderiales bacterium]|nr:hypothetical protein [Burkholderiales bacterium]
MSSVQPDVQSRRDFMLVGARTGAGVAAVAALASAPGAMAAVLSDDVATPAVSGDLLHTLGGRIGLEVANVIGTPGQPLALAYVDAAGPSVDALRVGLAQGVEWHTRCATQCVETQTSPSTVIAVAHLSNPITGASARVEIDAVALSVIGLIESINVPGSAQKNAVLTASADNLYRITYTG